MKVNYYGLFALFLLVSSVYGLSVSLNSPSGNSVYYISHSSSSKLITFSWTVDYNFDHSNSTLSCTAYLDGASICSRTIHSDSSSLQGLTTKDLSSKYLSCSKEVSVGSHSWYVRCTQGHNTYNDIDGGIFVVDATYQTGNNYFSIIKLGNNNETNITNNTSNNISIGLENPDNNEHYSVYLPYNIRLTWHTYGTNYPYYCDVYVGNSPNNLERIASYTITHSVSTGYATYYTINNYGTYYWKVSCYDDSYTVDSGIRSFVIEEPIEPDLTVALSGNTHLLTGEQTTITVTTSNIGEAASSPSITYVSGPSYLSFSIPSLAPGEQTTNSFTFSCTDPGNYTFRARADATSTNQESNENNNIDELTIVCEKAPSPPTITLLSPANNSLVVNPLNFTFIATSEDPTIYCDLYVDSNLIAHKQVTNNSLSYFDNIYLSNEEHYWQISCISNDLRSYSEVRYLHPNNVSIIDSCMIIDEPGTYYLNNSLNATPIDLSGTALDNGNGARACIVIESNDVTLDCGSNSFNGYLFGDSFAHYAIAILDSSNVEIRNCVVNNYQYSTGSGIGLSSSEVEVYSYVTTDSLSSIYSLDSNVAIYDSLFTNSEQAISSLNSNLAISNSYLNQGTLGIYSKNSYLDIDYLTIANFDQATYLENNSGSVVGLNMSNNLVSLYLNNSSIDFDYLDIYSSSVYIHSIDSSSNVNMLALYGDSHILFTSALLTNLYLSSSSLIYNNYQYSANLYLGSEVIAVSSNNNSLDSNFYGYLACSQDSYLVRSDNFLTDRDDILDAGYILEQVSCNNSEAEFYAYNNGSYALTNISNVSFDIELLNPLDGYHSNESNITFSWRLRGLVGYPLSCNLIIDGTPIPVNSSLLVINSYSTVLANGIHSWSVVCTDRYGVVASESRTLSIYNYLFELLSPENNSIVNSQVVNFYWQYFGNETINSTLHINNHVYYVLSSPGNNYYSVDLGADGVYNWYLTSDYASSLEYNFVVDSSAPLLTIVSPNDNTIISNNVTFDWIVNDSTNVICELFVNNTSYGNFTNSNSITLYLEDGLYYWHLSCVDEAGNSAEHYSSFVVSNSSLYVDMVYPLATTSSPVTFIWQVYGEDADCSLYIDNNLTTTIFSTTDSLTTYSTNLSQGNHSWQLICNSTSNYSSPVVLFTVSNQTIHLLTPEQNEILTNNSVNFSWYSDIADSCSLYLDGYLLTTLETNNDPISYLANVQDGSHLWFVRCSDRESEVRTFSIDNSAPIVSILYPLNNQDVLDYPLTIRWSVEDNSLATCDIYLNNYPVERRIVSSGTYTTQLAINYGSYNLSIVCSDGTNEGSDSIMFNYLVGVELLTPGDNSVFNGSQNVTLAWQLHSNETYNCSVYAGTSPSLIYNGSNNSTTYYAVEQVNPNPYAWYVVCGPFVSHIWHFYVVSDPALNITLLAPANNSTLYSPVEFSWQGSGTCYLSIYYSNYSLLFRTVSNNSEIISLPSGSYLWNVYCEDGLLTGISETRTLNIIENSYSSSIEIYSPLEGNTYREYPTLSFLVNGNEQQYSCDVYIDDTTYTNLNVSNNSLTNYTLTLNNNNHTLYLICRGSREVLVSDVISFVVDRSSDNNDEDEDFTVVSSFNCPNDFSLEFYDSSYNPVENVRVEVIYPDSTSEIYYSDNEGKLSISVKDSSFSIVASRGGFNNYEEDYSFVCSLSLAVHQYCDGTSSLVSLTPIFDGQPVSADLSVVKDEQIIGSGVGNTILRLYPGTYVAELDYVNEHAEVPFTIDECKKGLRFDMEISAYCEDDRQKVVIRTLFNNYPLSTSLAIFKNDEQIISSYTNNQGEAIISLSQGIYVVSASAPGYRTVSQLIAVPSCNELPNKEQEENTSTNTSSNNNSYWSEPYVDITISTNETIIGSPVNVTTTLNGEPVSTEITILGPDGKQQIVATNEQGVYVFKTDKVGKYIFEVKGDKEYLYVSPLAKSTSLSFGSVGGALVLGTLLLALILLFVLFRKRRAKQ